ncbi:MAG: RidA family protein [Actinomycetota bacterium]|nr:RidA family protein [Actinomycetota bacterium]
MSATWTSFGFGMPWEASYGFAQAIRAESTLYISGQLSHDMEGAFIGEGDFELQVRTAFSNFDRVLAHFGASKEQVVETTVLVKNLREYFDDIARLHAEYFGQHRPTSTLIGVADLALPPQLVEIAGVALFDLSE